MRCLRENRSIALFKELPEAALQQLLDVMERIEVPAGQLLFQVGEEVTSMYIVERGELEVFRRLQEDDQIGSFLTLGPGKYIGELGLFGRQESESTAYVRGDSPAVLWRLRRSDFTAIIEDLAAIADPPLDGQVAVCLPGGNAQIFVVSDGSCGSASAAVQLALRHFEHTYSDHCRPNAKITPFRYIRFEKEVADIVLRAREKGALIVHTVMREEPRRALLAAAEVAAAEAAARPPNDAGNGPMLRIVDLWEPMLLQMEKLFGFPRQSARLGMNDLSESCVRMIEAIEYTSKSDDGLRPDLWKEADVLLIGLSRSGKTPLSIFLAQRGYKVANYPAVPDEEPPKELFDPAIQRKVVGLTITPERLESMRRERMSALGRGDSKYASPQACRKECAWIKAFFERRGPRWPLVDTSRGGVEEQAAKILRIIEQASGGRIVSPSVV